MHNDVHPIKGKVRAAHLNSRAFPGRVGIEIPLNFKVDFEWQEHLKRAFEKKAPEAKSPYVWEDHVTLWVDKSKPEPELEQLYSCIEEANTSYRALRERREKSEKRREENRRKEQAELCEINERLRHS